MPAGLAHHAHAGATLQQKRVVEYRELRTVRLLNRCASSRVPFAWTINPYRGCEFGCKYCYARYTHEFLEYRESEDFERLIFAKSWDAEAFRRELRQVRLGQWIALGTATDPYQPAERRYALTCRILEVFARLTGYNLGITTKSDLAARDASLLAGLSQCNQVRVTLTVTTADAALARRLEPLAPRPELRFAALRTLSRAGVQCGVAVSPLMPGINDAPSSIDRVAREAQAAGARYFMGHAVFLKPSAAAVFLPFLDAEFPRLAGRYRHHFSRWSRIQGEYPERIQTMIREIRERYGLEGSSYWQPALEQGELDFGSPHTAAVDRPGFKILNKPLHDRQTMHPQP
jgi:DNA repair photolyase